MRKIAIHRGRNKRVLDLFRSITREDHFFDFRGLRRFALLNPFALLLKAFLTGMEIRNAHLYLCEGLTCGIVALFAGAWRQNTTTVVFVNGPDFSKYNRRSFVSRLRFKVLIWLVSLTKPKWATISQLVADDLRAATGTTSPIHVFYPSIVWPLTEECLQGVKDPHKIAFVCDRANETGEVKGLDVAIAMIKELRKNSDAWTLTIVGGGAEAFRSEPDGISCPGFLPIAAALKHHTYIISPARYETYNLSIVEGVACGLLPLASDMAGVAEVLASQSPLLVVSGIDPEAWAERIQLLERQGAAWRHEVISKLTARFQSLQGKGDDDFRTFIGSIC